MVCTLGRVDRRRRIGKGNLDTALAPLNLLKNCLRVLNSCSYSAFWAESHLEFVPKKLFPEISKQSAHLAIYAPRERQIASPIGNAFCSPLTYPPRVRTTLRGLAHRQRRIFFAAFA